MMYIDTKTFEVIGDLSDTRISAPLFECDELLAPTISILNKLGFTTEFCCSGHAYEYKEKGKLTPYWRDAHCYICFTKELEEMEKKGFVIPKDYQIMKSDDYFDVVEDGEAPWKLQIYKEFDSRESMFLQILDNAKALYTWACAMAYARNKECEATKKLMEETYVEIAPPYDWRLAHSTRKISNEKYATIITWKDSSGEEVQASVQDYYDFIKDLRELFYNEIGAELFKIYPKLKKPYEYSRMKYFIPPIQQNVTYAPFIKLIDRSLEIVYERLSNQYNGPVANSTVGNRYYLGIDELIQCVEKYIEENF